MNIIIKDVEIDSLDINQLYQLYKVVDCMSKTSVSRNNELNTYKFVLEEIIKKFSNAKIKAFMS